MLLSDGEVSEVDVVHPAPDHEVPEHVQRLLRGQQQHHVLLLHHLHAGPNLRVGPEHKQQQYYISNLFNHIDIVRVKVNKSSISS